MLVSALWISLLNRSKIVASGRLGAVILACFCVASLAPPAIGIAELTQPVEEPIRCPLGDVNVPPRVYIVFSQVEPSPVAAEPWPFSVSLSPILALRRPP